MLNNFSTEQVTQTWIWRFQSVVDIIICWPPQTYAVQSSVNAIKQQWAYNVMPKWIRFLSHMSACLGWKARARLLPICTTYFYSCRIHAQNILRFPFRLKLTRSHTPVQCRHCYTRTVLNNVRSCIIIFQIWNDPTISKARLYYKNSYIMTKSVWNFCMSSRKMKTRKRFIASSLKRSNKQENSSDFFVSPMYSPSVQAWISRIVNSSPSRTRWSFSTSTPLYGT